MSDIKYDNKLLFHFYRLMSHITFGNTRRYFKHKKSLYSPNYQIIEILKQRFDFLSDRICNIENTISENNRILEYKRVPGFDKKNFSVYSFVSAIVSCYALHTRAFGDKKYKYIGKDIVVTATGPSFQYYKPIKNVVHIGVNTAYRKSDVQYSAMFCQDPRCFGGKIEKDFITYRNDKCEKFIGNGVPCGFADINENEYSVYHYMSESKFNYFIDIAPLPDFCSVIFSAVAYALWTHPKRIYLVGADCSFGHAAITQNSKNDESLEHLIRPWKYMAEFIKKYYSDVEIISINPIGLRGMFKDVYTSEFLADNPEIDKDSVEILEL